MIPGINPKQMQQMMKKMGMKQEDIPAQEVIIKTETGNIIIKNPQVAKVDMMGQATFQISGEISEEEIDTTPEVTEEDIQTIIEQTGCSQDEAIEALVHANYDLAQAIVSLSEQ